MPYSTPSSSVLHFLPEFAQIHAHWVVVLQQMAENQMKLQLCPLSSSPAMHTGASLCLHCSGFSHAITPGPESLLPSQFSFWLFPPHFLSFIFQCQPLLRGFNKQKDFKSWLSEDTNLAWYSLSMPLISSVTLGKSPVLTEYLFYHWGLTYPLGFPHSSIDKESTCNAGDPGFIPGSGRSAGEGRGYPLQYSWAFLVAQLVKNLPAMRETWVRSLGWEDPLEKGKAYPLQDTGLESSMDCIVHGVAKSWTWLSGFHFHYQLSFWHSKEEWKVFCKE